jgi:hypothetical protein
MPEDRLYHVTNFCSLGPRPQIITGLFCCLLQQHFASQDNIESEIFRARLFRNAPDEDGSGTLLIEDATVWTPGRTQLRPGIIVKRNSWEHQKRFTLDSASGIDTDGNVQYTKMWRGSHTIFCIGREGAETEILVAETYRFLMHFGPVFRHYFGLLMFELLEVGALSMMEEEPDNFVVPITVGYGWAETWTVQENIAVIRDIRMSDIFRTYYGRDALPD